MVQSLSLPLLINASNCLKEKNGTIIYESAESVPGEFVRFIRVCLESSITIPLYSFLSGESRDVRTLLHRYFLIWACVSLGIHKIKMKQPTSRITVRFDVWLEWRLYRLQKVAMFLCNVLWMR